MLFRSHFNNIAMYEPNEACGNCWLYIMEMQEVDARRKLENRQPNILDISMFDCSDVCIAEH